MSDIKSQMLGGFELVRLVIAEMEADGAPPFAIAAVLFNEAGAIWRRELPDVKKRRSVVLHAAEVAITGQCQPDRF